MNEDLKYTFHNINEWLRFAEAKNAGLLALNIASIIGLLQLDDPFRGDAGFLKGIMIFLFCLSCCICLYSILPVINKGFRFYKKMEEPEFEKQKEHLNALFFGDIARLSAGQFLSLFEFKHEVKLTRAEKDFGIQITNNAEICVQKYNLFKIAAWFTFGTFVLGLCVLVIQ